MLADFEIKTAKATSETGSSLREMLVTALINSNRVSILGPEALKAANQEQKTDTSGVAQASGGPEKEKGKTADLIISAAVTEFEPQASGGSSGIGGGGGIRSGVLGAMLGGSLNKAHMSLDIRIIDALTSKVLAATLLHGQAIDISGAIMNRFSGKLSLGTGLSGYANTPMEKAIRSCIIEAVRYIAENIPANYYNY